MLTRMVTMRVDGHVREVGARLGVSCDIGGVRVRQGRNTNTRGENSGNYFYGGNIYLTLVSRGGVPYPYSINDFMQRVFAVADKDNSDKMYETLFMYLYGGALSTEILIDMTPGREDINPSRESVIHSEELDEKIINHTATIIRNHIDSIITPFVSARNRNQWLTWFTTLCDTQPAVATKLFYLLRIIIFPELNDGTIFDPTYMFTRGLGSCAGSVYATIHQTNDGKTLVPASMDEREWEVIQIKKFLAECKTTRVKALSSPYVPAGDFFYRWNDPWAIAYSDVVKRIVTPGEEKSAVIRWYDTSGNMSLTRDAHIRAMFSPCFARWKDNDLHMRGVVLPCIVPPSIREEIRDGEDDENYALVWRKLLNVTPVSGVKARCDIHVAAREAKKLAGITRSHNDPTIQRVKLTAGDTTLIFPTMKHMMKHLVDTTRAEKTPVYLIPSQGDPLSDNARQAWYAVDRMGVKIFRVEGVNHTWTINRIQRVRGHVNAGNIFLVDTNNDWVETDYNVLSSRRASTIRVAEYLYAVVESTTGKYKDVFTPPTRDELRAGYKNLTHWENVYHMVENDSSIAENIRQQVCHHVRETIDVCTKLHDEFVHRYTIVNDGNTSMDEYADIIIQEESSHRAHTKMMHVALEQYIQACSEGRKKAGCTTSRKWEDDIHNDVRNWFTTNNDGDYFDEPDVKNIIVNATRREQHVSTIVQRYAHIPVSCNTVEESIFHLPERRYSKYGAL